ncbi:hypothetical protein EAX61_12655 [Dokdonia sinensis]|uniref:YbjN domain-containing protein n=1 Tax=Dokdonia sinensis TaxID=2479847 RepID=A0A3M0FVW4_9FLAO|nr:hypothetical protein [Dokdonia sinensis]RMB56910.1 hypothetical protein EAX61_12655 [Dokdonia sinensis]
MRNSQLAIIFKDLLGEVSGGFGHWELNVKGVSMTCYTDEMHNRMRIYAPITSTESITPDIMNLCMEANFHTVLDVKYAMSDGMLYAAYIHPFKKLTESQFRNAFTQLYSAIKTFGTTYSGGELKFPTKDELRRDMN